MSSLNSWTFSGNLGSEPSFQVSPSGVGYATFDVAVNRWNSKEKASETMWVRCTCFGKMAENLESRCEKGDMVGVTGECWVRKYTRNDGSDGFSVECTTNKVEILSFKTKSGSKPASQTDDDWLDDEQETEKEPQKETRRTSTRGTSRR